MRVELGCEVFDGARVIAATGREGMNTLPQWRVELACAGADAQVLDAAGTPALLTLTDELEGWTRGLDLVVIDACYLGHEALGHRYAVELSAPLWRTTLRKGYRIWLEKSAHEVVQELLIDAGFPADQIQLRIAGETFQRDQITQYAETDWQFTTRLLAEEGFSYWFDDKDGKSQFVVGDGKESHDGIDGPGTVPFRGESGIGTRGRCASRIEIHHELTPTGTKLRDFDVRQPDVYIEGSAGSDELEHFEYPAFVPDASAAATRAQVRLEQLQRSEVRAECDTDCLRVQPGRIVSIDGARDADMNAAYVVTEVEHTFVEPAPGDDAATAYRNCVELVPSELRPVRPAPPAVRPRIDGVDRAVTTGAAGEEIHVDDLARVKLRFMWDPSGIEDDKSSTWARGLQWSLTGSMFLPRVGWEVAVMYVDGSPDRPFVMQRIYNGTAVVPYALPAAAATTALKSQSSPGGGGINEIRLADDSGSQELYIHASKDLSAIVGNDDATTVGTDMQHDVTLSAFTVVGGSHDFSVGAFRTVDVGTDYASTVTGTHLNIIVAMETQFIGANRVVECDTYFEGIAGAYALQCNQSNTITKGAYANLNFGLCNLTCGIAQAENVAGARVERINGDYNIKTGSQFTDNPWGLKRISAGDGTETAGGDIGCAAPFGVIKASTATVTAPAIGISGKTITIKASKLLAGALELSGGAMKVASNAFIKGDKVRVPAGGAIE